MPEQLPQLPSLPTPEDLARQGANTIKITALEAALNALPPPLGQGAVGLSNSLYAVLIRPPEPSGPGAPPSSDQVKLFALGIAMAIVMFVWCLIKNFLHSLPIIGSFVDGCTNDEQAIPPSITAQNKDSLDNFIASEVESVKPNISPGATKIPAKGRTFEEFAASISVNNQSGAVANLPESLGGAGSAGGFNGFSGVGAPGNDTINAAAAGLQLGQNATSTPKSSANIQQSSADTSAASTANSSDVQNSMPSQRDNATQDVRLSSEGLKKLFGL